MRKLTQAEFLAKAVAAHGVGRYDYSQTVYVGVKQRVKIGCPTHGVFEQAAGSHMAGRGCERCAVSARPQCSLRDVAHFIKRAQSIHGNKYDYSAAFYSGVLVPLQIICPIHGSFEQTPASHTSGNGCKECSIERAISQYSDTLDDFKKKAVAVHGDKYDYSKVIYINNNKKIIIACPIHGSFEQTPGNHKSGLGCPNCAHSDKVNQVKERNRIGWTEYAKGSECVLYFIKLFNEREEFYKIGVTMNSVERRYGSSLTTGGYHYEILATYKSVNTRAVAEWEQSILETFSYLRYKPANYFPGVTECFSSADEILDIFPL